MNTFYLTALIIFLSITIVASISDISKEKKKYMLIINSNIKYFSSYSEVKKFLTEEANLDYYYQFICKRR